MNELLNNAKQKMEKEREMIKNRKDSQLIIDFLLKRTKESESLCEDILQEHKTFKKCLSFINDKAYEYLSKSNGYVADPIVYEWAEDYYHLDDKEAEEKKKTKGECEGQLDLFAMMM